jgi:hypothetical protein
MKTLLLSVATVAFALMWWARPVETHERVKTTVSFDKEISRIVNRKCLMCHSENNLSIPFSTYEQTRPWARAIEEEVLRRHMPPWRAQPGYGQFANDIGLTNRELNFLVAWVEGNGPKTKDQVLVVNLDQGETADADSLKFDPSRWMLGKPELLKALPAHTVPAGQSDEVRRVVVDLGLTNERWVRGLEFKPGDRRVVRAVDFTVEGTGQWLGSWTPWYGFSALPGNVAYRLPAGAKVVAEIHSRGSDVDVNDTGSLAVYFADKAASSPMDLSIATNPDPSSTRMKKYTGSLRVASDVNVLAFKPANEAGLDSFEVSTRRADGGVRVLLLVRDVMPQWPTPYILKEPLRVSKDTELRVTYYYKAGTTPSAAPTLTAQVYSGDTPVLTTR